MLVAARCRPPHTAYPMWGVIIRQMVKGWSDVCYTWLVTRVRDCSNMLWIIHVYTCVYVRKARKKTQKEVKIEKTKRIEEAGIASFAASVA